MTRDLLIFSTIASKTRIVFLFFSLCISASASAQCLWYPDTDGDGFGAQVPGTSLPCGAVPPGYVSNNQDCNDASFNARAWTEVGEAMSSTAAVNTEIQIAPDGTPYIVYRWDNFPDLRSMISVKKFNGTTWVPVGPDPMTLSDDMANPDLAIDAAGIPYVSFVDVNQGSRVTVIRYNGSTWDLLGSRAFSPDAVESTAQASIVIGSGNIPYIFYGNTAFEGIVMRYNPASPSGWENVGSGPVVPSLGSFEYGIAMNSAGVPHIVYPEPDGRVSVMQFTGGIWQVVGATGFSDDWVMSPRLALGGDDVPYVSYFDGNTWELIVQRYAAGSGAWAKVGGPVYTGDAQQVLAVDQLGVPYVAYAENLGLNKITVARWVGTGWQTVAGPEFARAQYISMDIGRDNVPYLSFRHLDNQWPDRAAVFNVAPVISPPGTPTLSADPQTNICSGQTTELEATGNLHDATAWTWYAAGCGTGTALGTGHKLNVSPMTTTTYYARGEGACAPAGLCGQITINVTTTPTTPTLAATNVSVCPGGNTSLSIATGTLGNAATQRWTWYAGGCGAGTALGTGTTLTVNPSVTTTYYARGEGSCAGLCGSITIPVVDLPVATAPAITTAAVCAGTAGALTVTPVSNVASYQWRVRNGALWSDITNQTSATLNRAAADLQTYPAENEYAVVLKNSLGCEQTLQGMKILSFTQPAIASAGNPLAATICAGGNTGFEVTMGSGANLDYQWQVDNGGGFTNVGNTGVYADATTAHLKVIGAGAGLNSAQYRVSVRTMSGGNPVCNTVTSSAALLTVNTPPSVSTAGQPAGATVCAAGNASFSVTAAGTNLTYQWQENRGTGYNNIIDGGVYADATTAGLRITGAPAGMDGYTYRVQVSNTACSPVTSNATTLAIHAPPSIGGSGQPANVSLCSGSDAVFSVTAAGTNLSYQWQESNGASFFNLADGGLYSGTTTATLRITGSTAALDGHKYRIVVSNPVCVPVVSDGLATLRVTNSAVTIARQPEDATTCAGGSSTFVIAATGTDLHYQWQESTGAAFSDLADNALYTGTSTPTLTLSGAVEAMDGRRYRVVVSNAGCGTSAMSDGLAALTISTSGVNIISNPSDITICQGERISFEVSAQGSGLAYQWQVSSDGTSFTDIADQDGTYAGTTTRTLEVITAAFMTGNRYRVAVSNGGCQSGTSGEAVLIVSTTPGENGCPYVLLVSEGVSPNGDSILDYWVIQGIERYPRNRVKIYNVWGDLIYEQNGYVNEIQAWRGESNRGATLAGSTAPDGTYYYTIDLGDDNGKDSILKGFVLLKR